MTTADDTRELYLQLLRAWNARDAAAMADCFRDDGIMIGFDGSVADGRANILDHLSPIFADHPTASFVTIIRSIREAGTSCILLADAGMLPPGGTELNTEATARQTVVADRGDDGQWRIALFQNTPAALHWDDNARSALSDELQGVYSARGPLPE